jgi:NAD(P)-dependent dehydrogenase (short-subunit alcohol dehydrogenase family)
VSILTVAGFTNLGFKVHSKDYAPLSPIEGKTAVITGATGGLGRAAAGGLHELGARVAIVGRNRDRLAAVAGDLPGSITFQADLSLLQEIRRLSEELTSTLGTIDVLVNNVGVLFPVHRVTPEGIEATLATNLAGHFLLTNLLIPTLVASTPSRVINVTSGGMYTARIRPDRLEMGESEYKGAFAYALTKRGQVILTELYAEKMKGTGVVFHSMHPGWAKTEGVATSLPTFNRLLRPLLRTPEQGADTIVWLATAAEPGETTGRFWFDREPAPTHLRSSTVESEEERARLWQNLVELTRSDIPSTTRGG